MKISNKNTNPIYLELKKLRLINNSFLTILCNKTRDKKIRVIKDLKSKIIFLEKYMTTNEYYASLKYKDDDRKFLEKPTKITNIKTLTGNIKVPIIEDDLRRVNQFKNILKNKNVLDFGCGWGGFLRNIKNYKS